MLLSKFQSYWFVKINLIEQVLYGLFAITIMLSSYFNRSRLALAAIIFLVFYLTLSQALPWQTWVFSHGEWLVLTGAGVLSVLSVVKDRGLLSTHGFYRLTLILFVGVASYFWFDIANVLVVKLTRVAQLEPWLKYLSVELPLVFFALLLVWRCLREKSLVTTALLSSYCIWLGQYYQLITLPWSVLLTLMIMHYFFVVVVDSYFLAYRDELTTLPSRRALNQLALSLGRKYTLAMLDIDHFKKFNDTYGHDIGDQVLKLVASKLAQVKGSGKVFRYGGEEFTIVFPGKTTEQALPALEAVRQAVEDYKIVIRQEQRKTKQARSDKKGSQVKTVSVTISIGLAERASKLNFEQTLKLADEALYRAKKSGRNNVSE
ncbi:GGDEF domain-containing protein [Colwellia sp. BRX10-3]|uniref:GGDEF domain-containing protein n=1 Tax=Colwellia sp. BRX10-3 TaxID=2759844 RepID=UPI0015F3B3B7|nr:GGDEF domain-containing protein [Colwellia sp. BRX10-3]MBA6391756.1 GGDEF domain-containing protein [Colwellia sp. BRX10-3]